MRLVTTQSELDDALHSEDLGAYEIPVSVGEDGIHFQDDTWIVPGFYVMGKKYMERFDDRIEAITAASLRRMR